MPNPKQRKSTSAKNQRRSHHALKSIKVSVCDKCGAPKKPHYACPACGFYNGKDTKAKKEMVKKSAEKKTVKASKAKESKKQEKKK